MMRESSKTFGEALTELLLEEDVYVTARGKVNLRAFARELEGVHYQTLRRTVMGQRAVTPDLVEECARVLRVRPDYFGEYRVEQVRRLFDPQQVSVEEALRRVDELRPPYAA